MTDQTAQQEIATVEQRQPAPADSTAALLSVIERAAANPAVDIDKMERLLAMQERVLTRNAEMEYSAAMADAQSELGPIVRDAYNKQTGSSYAKLEAIAKAALPIINKHGFSLSFDTEDCPKEDHYRMVCRVRHSGGHSERHQADIPADIAGMKGTPNKTKTHAFGSTMSYGQRYMTILAFNLTFTDDDGNAAGAGETITPDQVKELGRMLDITKSDRANFLKFMKIERIEDMPSAQYGKADALLSAKLVKMQKEQADADS